MLEKFHYSGDETRKQENTVRAAIVFAKHQHNIAYDSRIVANMNVRNYEIFTNKN